MTPPRTPQTPRRLSTLRLALAAVSQAFDRAFWWLLKRLSPILDRLVPNFPDDETPMPDREDHPGWRAYFRAVRLRDAARDRAWARWHRRARNRTMVLGVLMLAFVGWCYGMPQPAWKAANWFGFVWSLTLQPLFWVRMAWLDHRDAKREEAHAEEIEREVAAEDLVREIITGERPQS